MASTKIYELAREFGIPSKEVASWAKDAGFAVKTHMSSVDGMTAEKIRKGLKKDGLIPSTKDAAAVKTRAKKRASTKTAEAKKETVADPAKKKIKKPPAKTATKAGGKGAKKTETPEVIDELEALERALQDQADQAAAEVEPPPTEPEPAIAESEEPTPAPEELAPQAGEAHGEEEPPLSEPVAEAEPEIPEPAEVVEPEETLEAAATETESVEETVEAEATPGEPKKVVLPETVTVKALAELLETTTADLLIKLMGMGQVSNVNTLIDSETAMMISMDYGFDPEVVEEGETEVAKEEEEEHPEELVARPPVVTVMGHVDHGKTSLLDAIRETNVTQTEAGSITQHIGAYHVTLENGTIVFLDTPGHEAFTAMRARGAEVTDIVILLVAADDGVMPQTREAIAHAKAAGVPIVVAVNKIDLLTADLDKVRRELTEMGLVPEEWGGDTIFVEVSAKQRLNIKGLLEMILLQAEILELRANPNRKAKCVVLEAELDKGRGAVARVLVQKGTLKTGDPFVVGPHHGRVRALINDEGRKVQNAGPSMPVEVLGISGVPQAGDLMIVLEDERKARQVASQRMQRLRQDERAKSARVTLEELYESVKKGTIKELAVVLKADAQGSIEALVETLEKLSGDDVRIRVIHSSVGGITESDVMLAAASNAVIVGFHVRPTPQAVTAAQREEVEIRLYNVIYDAIKEIQSAMIGLLEPITREVTRGRVEVREIFQIPRVGPVAGCYVTDGVVQRNNRARVVRDNIVVYEGRIGSLRRFKDDVGEVQNGFECGIAIENFQDVKQGDVIEPYAVEEVERTT